MTVATKDPIEDIGLGVRIERRYLDGELCGFAYWHPRPDGSGTCEGWINVRPVGPGGAWTLESERPLSVSPSLLCRACGHHGFIRDGKWVPA